MDGDNFKPVMWLPGSVASGVLLTLCLWATLGAGLNAADRVAPDRFAGLTQLTLPDTALPPGCSVSDGPAPFKGLTNRTVTTDPQAFVFVNRQLTELVRTNIQAMYYAVYREKGELGVLAWAFNTEETAKQAYDKLREQYGDGLSVWLRRQDVVYLWRDTGTTDKCFQHFKAFLDKKVGTEPARVAKLSGFSDQAAFLLYLKGNLILTNLAAWKENGTFESRGEGIAEGAKIKMATTLVCDQEGYWSEVSMEMPISKTGALRLGNRAVLTLPDGTTRTVTLKPGVFPFVGMVGLNLYTRFYDELKGGKQILPILIPHKKAEELSVERKGQFQRTVAWKKLELREFELKAGDLNALVWIDESGRLIQSQQLDEGSIFIRQGYEELRGER